jgi:sporulation protein YlmC with PRC-barrel domain
MATTHQETQAKETLMATSINTRSTTGSTETSRVLSASTLSKDPVYNAQGEKLGSIKEVMLDVDLGRVAYAVLSFGGFLGMGDKLFAIPFEALRVDTANKQVILDVPKDKLENAPGFDKDNWPATADRRWGAEIYRHYGYTPYWESDRITGRL